MGAHVPHRTPTSLSLAREAGRAYDDARPVEEAHEIQKKSGHPVLTAAHTTPRKKHSTDSCWSEYYLRPILTDDDDV